MTQVVGMKELIKNIKSLEGFIEQKQLLQDSGRKALRPYVRRARSAAPVGETGNLKRSIGIKSAKRSGVVFAGPRRGKYKGYHAHMLEYGTKLRNTDSGANRGRIVTNGFLRRTYEPMKSTILQTYMRDLPRKLNKYLAKALRKEAKR